MALKSRLLGVHSKDLPPRKALKAQLTSLNVGAMVILSERGVEDTVEVSSTANFDEKFGDYRSTFFGRYSVDGFFSNLRGVPGKLWLRRFVPPDAVAAEEKLANGVGAITSIITLVNELKLDYEAHRVLMASHIVADAVNTVSNEDAIDKESAIALANEVRSAFNAHIGDTVLATPIYHVATGTDATVVSPPATNIETLITLVNEIKAQVTIHHADTVAHTLADPELIAAADAAVPGSPENIANLIAGYRGSVDKGIHGNNLAYTIAHSRKFESVLETDATALDIVIFLEAISGIEVGDLMAIRDITNGNIEGFKVLSKNAIDNSITIDTDGAGAGLVNGYLAVDNIEVYTLNFDLTIHRKDRNGILIERELHKFLTVETGVDGSFNQVLNNQFSGSKDVKSADVTSSVTDFLYFNPYEIDTPVFFDDVVGVDGTLPVNQDWIDLFAEFDDIKETRFLAAPEATSTAVNKAGEAYCNGRGDMIWHNNLDPDQTFEQLKQKGLSMLGGEVSYGFTAAQHLIVSDPIGKGLDPRIEVPNVGHVMGHAIHRITLFGYQRVPAGPQVAFAGVVDVVGDQITNDALRTELADVGVNLIQFVAGIGIVLRNARMTSNDESNAWFNQRFMRIVYKKTFEESFALLENDETGSNLLKRINFSMRSFLRQDFVGQNNPRTGNKPAFLIITKADGTLSVFDDVVQITVDETNNDLQDVLTGKVNVELFFTPTPPAEDIQIGVGISLTLSAGE